MFVNFLFSSLCSSFVSVSVSVCCVAVRTIALLRHIVDFLGSRWMETAPTSIEVLLRPTLVQSDEPSDLRGSLSPTTRHRCTHVLVYTAPGSPRRSPIQLWARRCLTSVVEPTPMSYVLCTLCITSVISVWNDIKGNRLPHTSARQGLIMIHHSKQGVLLCCSMLAIVYDAGTTLG